MPRVVFTPNLQRHIDCPPREVEGGTVREALDAAFAGNERARGYVLDERGELRHHMTIYVDGERLRRSSQLDDPVPATAEVYVMQALSGG